MGQINRLVPKYFEYKLVKYYAFVLGQFQVILNK